MPLVTITFSVTPRAADELKEKLGWKTASTTVISDWIREEVRVLIDKTIKGENNGKG